MGRSQKTHYPALSEPTSYGILLRFPREQLPSHEPLSAQDMNDVNSALLRAIVNAAGRDDQLAIGQAVQFGGIGAETWKPPKPFDSSHQLSNQLTSCRGIVQRNIVRDGVQVLDRGVGQTTPAIA